MNNRSSEGYNSLAAPAFSNAELQLYRTSFVSCIAANTRYNELVKLVANDTKPMFRVGQLHNIVRTGYLQSTINEGTVNIPIKQYWELLVVYLAAQRRRVLLLMLLLGTNIVLQLVNPLLLRTFIDNALNGSVADRLFGLAALFFGLAILQQIISVIATYTGEHVAWTATNLLRYDLAKHCLYLDMSFHNQRSAGEMIERIDGDVNTLSNFFSQFLIKVVGNGLLLLGILALLFRIDWRIGAALAVFVLIAAWLMARLRNISVPHWQAASEAQAELFGFLEERLAGTQDIRSSGAIAYTLQRFYLIVRKVWRSQIRAGLMVNIMINTTFVLIALANATAFILGGTLFTSGAITIGTVYLVFHYTSMLMTPIEQIMQQLEDLQKAGASIIRVRELTTIKSKLDEGGNSQLPSGALDVHFNHVGFAYQDGQPVLHDVSFQLRRGSVLGILGRTGSGKTTITRLLTRLYDPSAGSICLGNVDKVVDLRQTPLAQLPQHIGMVTQHVQLFNASVRDNLTFFDRSIPDARILQTIHSLGLGRWFAGLSDGLDTVLASGAAGLSAGEAQLLAFTRIFLKDPGIVILDEASSRLDPATEHLIERAIDQLVAGRTVIIIAHRLKTIERADEILILQDGMILERGLQTQLRADPQSHFSALLQTGMQEVLA